jgi:small-conductance mechanosensitive channel
VAEQLAMWVLFAVPLFLLRRRESRWLDVANPAVKALVSVARRPISAALLPAFMVAAIWRGRITLDSLLLLLPLLRVVPQLLPAGFKPLIWGIAGVYVGNQMITQNFARALLPGRLLILILIAAMAILVRRLALSVKTTNAEALQQLPPSIRTHGFTFCLAVLGVALVAEVTGLTALASYLSTGVVRTLFGAALLFAFLRISHGFLQLMIETPEGVIASYFTREPDGLAQRLSIGIRWLARIFLALLILEIFDLTTPLLQAWRDALAYQFEAGAIEFTAGSVVILVTTIAATVLLSRVIQFFLGAAVFSRVNLGRGVGDMVSKLLHYSLLTAGFLFAIGAAGLDLNRFTLLMGALGVGIGLGLQSVVGNFMSGLILLVERPFGVGDVVTVGDLTGVVTDVGIRSTRLRTWNGADIAVPNSNLTSTTVTNWSLVGHQRGNEITVGVAYGSDPNVVTSLLETAAREHPAVLTEPPPAAFFSGFGQSSLDFTLRYWTELANFLTARSALHTTIYRRLGEAGIEIPFPQQDVRLTVEQTSETKNESAPSVRAQTSLPTSQEGVART